MSTKQSLRTFILENYLFTDDQSALADADSFLEKGVLDSTGIMEVVFFIEEQFGIRVDDEEMVPQNLDSIDHLVTFIERKKAA